MPALTENGENRTLNWHTGNSTTAPTLPLKIALCTTVGTESTPGTEATGGSYARQTVAFGTAVAGIASNSGVVRFEGLTAGTYQSAEIWDSAGTPFRWWHAALPSPKTVNAGDAIEFPIGTVQLTLD